MRLPETWRTEDGSLLRIRTMSNKHIAAASRMLRALGYMSYREWKNEEPPLPFGMFESEAGVGVAFADSEGAWRDTWEAWLSKRHHIAIDAFATELAYRRRHRIVVTDDESPIGEPV
jgi:hypothetical protein